MKLFLSNVLKGLILALVVIFCGGFILLNINMTPSNTLVLISSSVINSIETEFIKEEKVNEEDLSKEENEVTEEKEEVKEVLQTEDSKINLEIKEDINSAGENKQDENNNSEEKEEIKVEQPESNKQPSQENQQIVVENSKPKEEVKVQGSYNPNLAVANTIEAIETYHGKMTGYGPDCVGCSGITASGRNVKNGNIYYNDQTFGTIRIVAGDRSIPFGSIIKITGLNISSDPILAIVLDRGGMIGFAEGKHSYFDLLYETEKAASSFGRQTATFELLRSGY